MSRSASSSHVLVKCASLGGAAWSFHSHRGLSLVSSFLFLLWPFLFTLFRKLSQLLEYHICRSHIDSLGKNIALNCPQQWAMSMVCGVALWRSLFCRNTWYSFLNCTYYPDVCNVTLTDSHICDQRNNLSVGSFFLNIYYCVTICTCLRKDLHKGGGAHRGQSHYISLELGLIVVASHSAWVLETELGPLEEQDALFHQPSHLSSPSACSL